MDKSKAPTTPSGPDAGLTLEQSRADLALSAAGMGEFDWDLVADTFFVTPRLAAIIGLPAGASSAEGGSALAALVHPDDRDDLRRDIAHTLKTCGRSNRQFRMLRPIDGKVLWMESASLAIGPEGGAATRVIGVLRDCTDRKARDDEREAFVGELDQRVKNTLASVQSMASQTARRTVSLEAFLKAFSGRLDAMAAAHVLLTSSRWRGAAIGTIAAAELGGLTIGQAQWEGPDLVLNPRATNTLTLALHELGANAVKYGALSVESGAVAVTWRALPEGGFELIWDERGGPTVEAPSRQGFGATLLERVTGRELGGAAVLEFRPEGVRAVIRADASALAEPGADEEPHRVADDDGPEAPATFGGESHGDWRDEDIQGLRVLIVEDSVLLALELEAGLTEAGATVVGSAATFEEGARMLELDFHVAVLDANLNGRSAAPLGHTLAARGVPFIFATGYDKAGAAPEGFAAPVVPKPYNIRQIARALKQALGPAGNRGSPARAPRRAAGR